MATSITIQQMQAEAKSFYTRFSTFRDAIKRLDPQQQILAHQSLFEDAELFDELVEKVDAAFKPNSLSKQELYEVVKQVNMAEKLLEKIQAQGAITLEVCGVSEDILKAKPGDSNPIVDSLQERITLLTNKKGLNFGLKHAVYGLQVILQQRTQNPSSSISIAQESTLQESGGIQAEIDEEDEVDTFADQLRALMKKTTKPSRHYSMAFEFYNRAEAYCSQKLQFLVPANQDTMEKVLKDADEYIAACIIRQARIDQSSPVQRTRSISKSL